LRKANDVKARLLAGALGFALWGGAAATQDVEDPSVGEDDVDRDTQEQDRGIRGAGESWDGGAGVDGYTGQLAHLINPGPAWGVTAAIRPVPIFGIEFGYTGGANTVRPAPTFGGEVQAVASGGGAVVRSGGSAALSLGLNSRDVQPSLLGGVGASRYSVRGEGELVGLRDDTVGQIPLGGGLRAHIGDFTADARLTVNPLFNNQFSPEVGTKRILGLNTSAASLYTGTLQLGATF
jgi:hypothetical protein